MGNSKKEVNIQTHRLAVGLLIVFIMSIVISIVLKLFGISWFDLYISADFYNNVLFGNILIQNIILGLSLMINTILILGITLKLTLKEVLKHCWVYFIFITLINMRYGNELGIMLLVFIPILLKHNFHYKPILRFASVILLQSLYCVVIFWLRSSMGFIEIIQYDFSFYETIILNIDMYLMMGIIYILVLKGVKA